MKKMRRFMTIGLILLMVVAMAGCGEQNDTVEEENIQCGLYLLDM